MYKIKKSKKHLPDSRFWILDSSSGFTLIEVLVAVTLFSVIVAIATGGLSMRYDPSARRPR